MTRSLLVSWRGFDSGSTSVHRRTAGYGKQMALKSPVICVTLPLVSDTLISKCGPGLPLGYGQTSVTVNELGFGGLTVAAPVSVLTAVKSPA